MDDYTREMMDLKTLVTRTLEKKGVLAKIRAELRASVFEAIEEEDRVIENNEGLPPALLGSCNDRARKLHASPLGRLLSALICEYLDWAQLNHTLKVYQPECNLPKDSWKSELSDFSSNNGYELNRNGDSRPLLLDVLEGFLKFENMTQVMGGRESESESSSSLESRNPPRRSSTSDSLPPQQKPVSASQASERRATTSGYTKEEHNWRYDNEDAAEEVMRASAALENLQLDRKTRNLTSSWRHVRDGTSEEDAMKAQILQSSSSLHSAFSSGSINRYRFSSIASSPKPLSISFTQTTGTKRAPCVLSMSKKYDATDSLTYKDSGVDIDAGTELVKRIAKMAPGIGGFGGLFPLGDSFLVAGTDGVGTKLKLAFETGIHDTIGIDLVAMSVNDIITSGAKPLFFLDYFATSRLDVDLAEKVIKGIVDGCKQSDCALLGGETAEMPDFYAEGEYDLSGFAVGIVKKNSVINGKNIVAGDVLIGLPSSGVHSNGFSLVRKVIGRSGLLLKDELPGGSTTLGDALMAPTVIYVKQVLDFISKGGVKGIAHITGGGFTDNIPRVFPNGLGAVIHTDAWELPPLFKWIQQSGNIEDGEMRRTFNLGIGMVMVVSPEAALRILGEVDNGDYAAYRVGEVVNGEGVSYL